MGAIALIALSLALGACTTPAKPAPPPPRQAVENASDPLFDPATPRQEKTVLEALWALEKQVRERDARILSLEERVRSLKLELRRRDEAR